MDAARGLSIILTKSSSSSPLPTSPLPSVPWLSNTKHAKPTQHRKTKASSTALKKSSSALPGKTTVMKPTPEKDDMLLLSSIAPHWTKISHVISENISLKLKRVLLVFPLFSCTHSFLFCLCLLLSHLSVSFSLRCLTRLSIARSVVPINALSSASLSLLQHLHSLSITPHENRWGVGCSDCELSREDLEAIATLRKLQTLALGFTGNYYMRSDVNDMNFLSLLLFFFTIQTTGL